MQILARIIICLFCFLAATAVAKEEKHPGTIISLSENASVEVQEDLLTANLQFSVKSTEPRLLQEQINDRMSKAFDIIKSYETVELTSKQYSVYQQYDHSTNKPSEEWQGHQAIDIESKDADLLLKLVAKLQDLGLTVNSLQYQLSHQKREEAYNALIEPTIEKLMNKAKKVAKALDKDEIEVLKMNIDSIFPDEISQDVIRRGAMEKHSMSEPVASAGKSIVSAIVSAQILIKN